MYETLDSRRGIIFAAGLIVLATMAAYSNSLSGPFLFDDVPSIIENPTIRHLWPIGRILLPPGQYAAVQRRPLVNASLAINYAISGENTWSYHALNLAMHAAAALLLFGIVRRTLLLPRTQTRFARAATPLAATVALLWAVHPLLTDAVTYIIQRTEIMAGLFYLLAMYCTIRGATSPRAGRWYVAAAAACVAAMSSKEAAMSAPVVAAIYDRVFLSESWRQVWHRRGGLYLGMALGWILVLAMLPYGAEGTGVFGGPGEALEYAMAQSGVIAHYLQLAFWPHPLVFDYGMYDSESAAQIVPFIVLIVALALAVVEALAPLAVVGIFGRLVLCDPGAEFQRDSAASANRRRKTDVFAPGGDRDGGRHRRIPRGAMVDPPRRRLAANLADRRRLPGGRRRDRVHGSDLPPQFRLSQRAGDLAGYRRQNADKLAGARQSRLGLGRARAIRRRAGRIPKEPRHFSKLCGGL